MHFNACYSGQIRNVYNASHTNQLLHCFCPELGVTLGRRRASKALRGPARNWAPGVGPSWMVLNMQEVEFSFETVAESVWKRSFRQEKEIVWTCLVMFAVCQALRLVIPLTLTNCCCWVLIHFMEKEEISEKSGHQSSVTQLGIGCAGIQIQVHVTSL